MSKNVVSQTLSQDPVMAVLVKKFPKLITEWEERQNEKRDVFTSISRTIVGQQLSVKAASTIWGRVEKLVGEITPENILKHKDADYREVGCSWAKAGYLVNLAKVTQSGEFNPEKLRDLENDQAKYELIKLKGIGPWSAEMILMFTLNRPDIFSIGDMGLKNAVSNLYDIDKTDEEKIIKIAQKWSPYRTVACLHLWESLDNTPE